MAQATHTLGIIVNSNRYFDYVTHLAEAAAAHGKTVRIHLLGAGCQYAATDACMQLNNLAQFTMCAKSSQQMERVFVKRIAEHIPLVPPQTLTRLLEQCDRHVVF
jgi:predicted peroxiredoxin